MSFPEYNSYALNWFNINRYTAVYIYYVFSRVLSFFYFLFSVFELDIEVLVGEEEGVVDLPHPLILYLQLVPISLSIKMQFFIKKIKFISEKNSITVCPRCRYLFSIVSYYMK